MQPDDLVYGKVYFGKIKEDEGFSSPDYVLFIGKVGKDKIDVEDFRNIVSRLNTKWCFTPLLSTEVTTWKYIRLPLLLL